LHGRLASAQTTGSIVGQVIEKESGRPLGGVTVVLQGPQGDSGAVTGDDGAYEITALPVGTYVVHFYFGNASVEQQVVVSVDKKVRVNARVPVQAAEVIQLVEKAPAIDVGSSRVGRDVEPGLPAQRAHPAEHRRSDREGARRVHRSGRFLQSASAGLSFNGTTGAENNYILDGMNMTSVAYGTLGFDLAAPFVEEIEIINGGYGAEYGRAMGGVVNIATKSGSNEFHGSAFPTSRPRTWRSRGGSTTGPAR